MQSTTITIAGLFVTLTLASCDSSATTPSTGTQTSTTTSSIAPPSTVLPSGLTYTVLKDGQGDSPKLGSAVSLNRRRTGSRHPLSIPSRRVGWKGFFSWRLRRGASDLWT